MVNAKQIFKQKALVLSLSSALGLMMSGGVFADSSKKLELDIKGQKAGSALMSLGESASVQIVFSGDLARNVRVSAINGQYSLDSALSQMLSGTGLTYEFLSENTVLIKAQEDVEAAEDEADVDEEVIVTGTRLRNVKSASNVVTFTREEIDQKGIS